jgi:hypothetical protein
MGEYFKRFFIGNLLILVIVAFAIFYFGGSQIIAILLFVVLIEFLFYYLDSKYLPERKARITNELIKTFKAKPFSDGILKFKIESNDFFAETIVDFKLGLQIANIETIKFHLPRNQVNQLSIPPEFELVEDEIDGIKTYGVYQTNRAGLKLAQEKLREMT